MPKKISLIAIVAGSLLFSPVWAQTVPVVDINQDSSQATPVINDPLAGRESLPPEQRLRLLEQQMNNLVQMNLPAKLDSVQQQLQQLNGQLEVQAHEVQVLTDQLKNFYQDLDKRIGGLKNPTATSSAKPVATATTKAAADTLSDTKTAADAEKIAVVDEVVPATDTAPPSKTVAATPADKIAQAQSSIARNEATTAVATVPPTKNTVENEKKTYDNALETLSKKHNDEAIIAFSTLVKAYPKGSYAPNAHYWLGQLYNMKGKKDLAAKEYGIVIKQFPHSSKVPDALLNLAGIHMDAGKTDQALRELQVLIHQYPHSSAAQQANVELQALKVPSSTIADPE